MVRLRFQIAVCALILVHQVFVLPTCANPENVSKQPDTKAQINPSQPNKVVNERPKGMPPKSDAQFVERTIKTHVPAPGQFLIRRQRIWETLKHQYAERRDITQVLRKYVQMNESVNRGTNWVIDDSGNYIRMRPLSAQCRELEDALKLPWQSVGK
ncbi:MAG: hypothetical protein C0469_14345 [Cyanobacteria bacterium DS2.3.42]|nr:hypothetical protein [Cyanobacteria bacterium DS2.3.42]